MSGAQALVLGSNVLGVIVPCRDEARTIGRKLANLARCTWPAAARAHELVIVDDGSTDGTVEIARAACERLFPGGSRVHARVVANGVRPGKPGALAQGLASLGEPAGLVVLTDADVVIGEQALVELARAFEVEPELALACGAQHFVASLADDGSLRAADGGELVDASAPFDRWTARVRRLESRWGRLFSVHGQLLAWRAELGLAPPPGRAADDLELCLAVRARRTPPRRVRLVRGADFHECKTPPGRLAREQARRRARAWFQTVRGRTEHAARAPYANALEHAQWLFYRWAPSMAPRLTWLVPLTTLVVAGAFFRGAGVLAAGFAWLVLFTSPPGWRWLALTREIAAAARAESASPLADRWETPRS
jgi:glycosyltransferase involved in cell wall biosynthesis